MHELPTSVSERFDAQVVQKALAYIEGYWDTLQRHQTTDKGTIIGLPHPYLVPSSGNGSGFSYQEIYYWDSYFMVQGLWGTDREYMVKDITDNLLYLMQRFGVIPNSGRMYHTGRSQPPFLTTLIRQVFEVTGDLEWLEQSAAIAQLEYETVWMGTEHPHWRQVFEGLSRYYDVDVLNDLAEAESGWDMTTRFDRRALSFLPVDLNALLYKYETDLGEISGILGRESDAEVWQDRAAQRQKVADNYLWDSHKGGYFDFDYSRLELGEVWSLATYFPMWSGMASERQAADLVKNLQRFDCPGGLSTTAKEPQIGMVVPTQWAYPNGWAPLEMIVIEGLERYGYQAEARLYARKWLATNLNWFNHREEFLEKYNVAEPELPPLQGLYPNQVGFGWTNAVFVRFAAKYLDDNER